MKVISGKTTGLKVKRLGKIEKFEDIDCWKEGLSLRGARPRSNLGEVGVRLLRLARNDKVECWG